MMKFNKYDYAIVLLLTSLVFGVIGGAYQPVRLLAVLFIPLAVSSLPVSLPRISPLEKFVMLFVCCFCGYAWISLLWTPDRVVGLKEAVYYPVHIALFCELILFSKCANNPKGAFFRGWILATLLTFPIGATEILMDKHLPVSILQEGVRQNYGAEYGVQNVRFASATFGNYNTYNLFLVWSACVIASALLSVKNRLFQYALLAMLGGSVCIVLLNASRGGIVSLGIIGGLFLMTILKRPVFGKKLLLFFGVTGGGIVSVCFLSELVLRLSSRLNTSGLFSDEGRLLLITEGFKICWETLGLGMGIGSMASAYFSRLGSLSILAAHNIVIELFIQYGIAIGILFVVSILKIFFAARNQQDIALRYLALAGVLSSPIWGIINSGYWTNPSVWAFWATLCVATSIKSRFERGVIVVRAF